MLSPADYRPLPRLLFAALLLNAVLTFRNLWPTPWVLPTAELSLEAALLLAALALHGTWRGRLGRGGRWLVAVVVLLFVLLRYADVTAHALFGRAIDLYWDLPYLPDVMEMLATAAPPATLVFAVAAALTASALMLGLVRAAVGIVDEAMTRPLLRRATLAGGAFVVLLFAAGRAGAPLPDALRFAKPVSVAVARQVQSTVEGMRMQAAGGKTLGAPLPGAAANLAKLSGSDVVLLFLESYGAVAFDQPRYGPALAPHIAALERSLRGAGFHMASARLESPTFGGGSWLAHATLLSGADIEGQRDYRLLLASHRETLVQRFRRAGYRTVILMPGIQRHWPEGRFYGFDTIYDAAALDYRGPEFGWWRIPDQYTLDFLYRRELRAPGRQPVFAVMATVMSHMPFHPLPPYVDDWTRLSDGAAFGEKAPQPAAGWSDPSRDYRRAIRYDLDLFAGFALHRLPEDALLIVLGDHQPPAAASGDTASHDVPIHVLSRRPELVRPFLAGGFAAGLTPPAAPGAPMQGFAARLLAYFDGGAPNGQDVARGQLANQPARGTP